MRLINYPNKTRTREKSTRKLIKVNILSSLGARFRVRTNRSNSAYYPRTYTRTSTYVNQYSNPSSTTTLPSSSIGSNGKTIYTGSWGGKYYINSSGNKVYVKSENSTSTTTNSNSKSNYYSPSTSTSRAIQTGPRGGKYYINSNGNKTYVKKKNWFNDVRYKNCTHQSLSQITGSFSKQIIHLVYKLSLSPNDRNPYYGNLR